MKLLWVLTFFTVFSAEVRVKASYKTKSVTKTEQILSCDESWIKNGQLINGCHWVRAKDIYTLKTVYGEIVGRNSDFTVRTEGKKIFIVNNQGELKVVLRDGRSVQLPPGFELWISELDKNKQNQMGQITPVEMRDYVVFLGKLWTGSAESLKEKLADYNMRWGNRVEMASIYYKGLALRKIASVEDHEAKVQTAKEREAARRAANRKLLFQRVFER